MDVQLRPQDARHPLRATEDLLCQEDSRVPGQVLARGVREALDHLQDALEDSADEPGRPGQVLLPAAGVPHVFAENQFPGRRVQGRRV